MKVTNINRSASVDFTIPGKGGKGPTVTSIRAGESDNVDLPADDPQMQAYLHTKQISTGSEAAKPASAPAKPAAS